MYYVSTRDVSRRLTASQAIVDGLSRDGGLYLPEQIPQITTEEIKALAALSYPERMEMPQRLDIFAMKALEFKAPDEEKFPCLRLAKEAVRAGHAAQVVLNAANEALVARFLAGGLRFTDIPRGVEEMLRQHIPGEPGSIDEVLVLDEETRHRTEEWMKTR